ncbi:MAG: GEVED domain-containing protein [Bacteroidetes bacterium]|nr:GEVED domain-containing protein [Bacteroidota bacterium]
MNIEITNSEISFNCRLNSCVWRTKRLPLLAVLFIFAFLALKSEAQVCCPDFRLQDAVEICPSAQACSSQGGNQANPIVACKLSAHTYTVFPNLLGYTYTWTITGGTPVSSSGNPVTISWGAGATGYITVVINGGIGCHDSIAQPVCLVDGPRANFTAVPNPVCAGSLVHFTNTSTGGSDYLWDFGDGTTSDKASPPDHIFPGPGFYTVILTASDKGPDSAAAQLRIPCGCSDTASVVIHVLAGVGPKIETTCCFGTRCPGDTSSFCTSQVCSTYNWSVAGGAIVAGAGTACIKVKWNAVYSVPTTVSLAVPGCAGVTCSGTTTIQVPVLYPNLPISGPTPFCVGSGGSYFLPSMPGTYYSWTTTAPAGTYTFNEANRNVASVNLTFNTAGTFQIMCNYNNPLAGCSGTSSFTVTILPVFSISGPEKVCPGSTENYFGSGAAAWSVTGPGVPTIVPVSGNPTAITWNTPGLYTITATPPPGSYCNVNAIKVVRVVAIPVLGPITGPTLVCPGSRQAYTITSNTAGVPFSWTVSAGGTVQTQFAADQSQAIIMLTGAGPWTISVVQRIEISPAVFCSSLPQTLVVNAYGPSVVTGSSPVCIDNETSFSATGAGRIIWTISPSNRGSITSGQGSGAVSIRWHGPAGVATVTASSCGGPGSIAVTILNSPAKPTISASNGVFNYCLPSLPPAGYTLGVPGTYVTYQWYGPGGLISGATNHLYTPPPFPAVDGSYVYTVVVSNGQCSVSSNCQVVIGNCVGGGGTPPNPVNCAIDFTINPNPACEGVSATFTATQVLPNITDPGFSYQWSFGDGATSLKSPTYHSYTPAFTYNVTLTATLGTCVATKVIPITVNPTPACLITVNDTMFCPGSYVAFTACPGMASYQWYKDGIPVSGATGSGYNANHYGNYWAEVSTLFGCTNKSNEIFIYEKASPAAIITGEGNICAAACNLTTFQLSSFFDSKYSYSWSSVPGGALFSPNNSHLSYITNASLILPCSLPYTAMFIVKVTDTVSGCENFDTLCVTFNESPLVSVPFYTGCEGPAVTLTPMPNNPVKYHYQWSNGKTTPINTVSAAGNYGLIITDKISGCMGSVPAATIFPLPDLSLFPRGCDTICDTATFHFYIPLPLDAAPPFNTYSSAYPVIQWIDNGNYATPVGLGQTLSFIPGSLGNHQISVVVETAHTCRDTAGIFCLNVKHCIPVSGLDFGDAPDNLETLMDYPTLLASNGARHTIVPGVYLGSKVDPEPNGQPSVGANCDDNDCVYPSLGDDEDGVAMPAAVLIGGTVNITVTASVPGYLDAWVDYNVDGDWADAGEHVFTTLPLTAGPNPLSFVVPAGSTVGSSYARFRFRLANTAISYDGLATDGEVEDYPVLLSNCLDCNGYDFGDAPDNTPIGYHYPTLLSSNGARHRIISGIQLGALIDAEADGQPNATATGDDLAGLADEDGVQFIGTLYAGHLAYVNVTASVPGFLNAWMDFSKNGDWTSAGEHIFTNQPLTAGINHLSFMIPTTAEYGFTRARFRFNTVGGLNYFGLALDGEVEDYRVLECPYWVTNVTSIGHTITLPGNLGNIIPGDVIGVFYHDDNGVLACGGMTEYTGTGNQVLIAYGDNPATPIKDGFAVNESFDWILCSEVAGYVDPIYVTYNLTYPNYNGVFTPNGVSALTGITGLQVTATAAPGKICSGDAVQLHADAGGANGVVYTWSSIPQGFTSVLQNPVAQPSVNTTYFVDAFDGFFHANASIPVTVTQVNPMAVILPLQNITIPSGQSNCYNAIQEITAGGNGTTFVVQNGGSVNMIAGQKITFLEGVKANSGSYLHGMITTTGAYCCNTVQPAPAIMNESSAGINPEGNKPFFKVYPNPTTGTFTLELNGVAESSKVSVEIYGILGEKIIKTEMMGTKQHVFDLSGKQHGIYLIRVMDGEETGMTKIIRQ